MSKDPVYSYEGPITIWPQRVKRYVLRKDGSTVAWFVSRDEVEHVIEVLNRH